MRKTLLAMTLLALSGLPCVAETVTLRFAIPGSGPGYATWTEMWQPWIARVEAASQGTLKLQPFFGGTLATMFNVYDRTVSGAADLGTGVQGAIGGKFPGSSVVELPSDIIGKEGAASFWKIYADGLVAAEYSGVRPLALFVYPQSFLNLGKPVTSLADVKGLKLATLTKADAGVAQRLGAAPLSTSPTDVYEMLQHRGADGVIIGWLGLVGFKLAEVTSYHLVDGLGSGGGFLLMNQESYAKLPPLAQQAIDRNSGYEASKSFGAALDRIYAESQAAVRSLPGHAIAALPPAERQHYESDIVRPLTEDWTKTIPNGAAILAAYRAEAIKVRQEK